MARLTKTEIEQSLLQGVSVQWKDEKGKTASITLADPKQRRLLAYMLASKVREVKGLPETFSQGLANAFVAGGDPGQSTAATAASGSLEGPWKIQALRAEGFGGVNAWKGKPFELALDQDSLLVEGPNGSGKSSLTAAIVWVLSGERPRDQAETNTDETKPVYGANKTKAGDWPPIATYPDDLLDILLGPKVSVEITFANPAGKLATAKRTLDGTTSNFTIDPALYIPPILLEAGLLMPARLPTLRLDEGRGRLSDAVQALKDDIRKRFVSPDRYAKCLKTFSSLAESGLLTTPKAEAQAVEPITGAFAGTETAYERVTKVRHLCRIAEWFESENTSWTAWWKGIAEPARLPSGEIVPRAPESLVEHVLRVGSSMTDAEPYRVGAEAMRKAWKEGAAAFKIDKEVKLRQEIAEALSPLKNLSTLAEAQARDALNDLSTRIGAIHSTTYISEALKFETATLEKKAGLVVRGAISQEVRIDATLIANTSWIRGVLWAFIFALREEAVSQMGSDQFPVLVLDDPQQTFDSVHRHRWAEHIASLQKASPGVQVILATHDDMFLSFLEIDGVTGRRALIASAGKELGHIGVFEGDELDRRWKRVEAEKTPKAAQDYMYAMRLFIEGMLKLMLRGEDIDVSSSVVGGCREKLSVLHKAGIEPWNRPVFEKLANLLGKAVSQVKHIELACHSAGAHLGMTEAVDVEKYWTKALRPTLERAFRIAREHRALHGGLTALHALPPSVSLPEGYKAAVMAIGLPIIGSAAALSDGRAADGCVNLNFDGSPKERVVLNNHHVFRVTVPTLEPVARPGDLLIVDEGRAPGAKSLVVALNEDRLLARRLEIADNHSDVAVLTASAINPRMIAPPVVAKFSTLSMHKIVGVLYSPAKTFGSQPDFEFIDCGGESNVKSAFANMYGLVEVNGHSAEPHALDKQFLIIAKPIPPESALPKLEGAPVVVEDGSGKRYFKRLRTGPDGFVILESLEIGGDFSPVSLKTQKDAVDGVKTIWPVLGVLFEKPI